MVVDRGEMEHIHQREPTRTGPCTLNAVGLLSLDVETRGLPPLATPHLVVCVEKFTLPYLTWRLSARSIVARV